MHTVTASSIDGVDCLEAAKTVAGRAEGRMYGWPLCSQSVRGENWYFLVSTRVNLRQPRSTAGRVARGALRVF